MYYVILDARGKKVGFFSSLPELSKNQLHRHFEQEIFVTEGESYNGITHLLTQPEKEKYFLYIT